MGVPPVVARIGKTGGTPVLHSNHVQPAVLPLSQVVILSGVAASQSEAAAQSKDPLELHGFGSFPRNLSVTLVGVLRLRPPIRKRMGGLHSG